MKVQKVTCEVGSELDGLTSAEAVAEPYFLVHSAPASWSTVSLSSAAVGLDITSRRKSSLANLVSLDYYSRQFFTASTPTIYLPQVERDQISASMTCVNPVSTAKLFVQLAPSRTAQPVLDFLVPGSRALATTSTFTPAFRGNSFKTTRRSYSVAEVSRAKSSWRIRSSQYAPGPAISGPFLAFRASTRRYTQTAYNPQKDDDGIDMKLEITPRAAKVSLSLLSRNIYDFAVTLNTDHVRFLSASRTSWQKTQIRT